MISQSTPLNIPPGRVAQRVKAYQGEQKHEQHRERYTSVPRAMTMASDSGEVVGHGHRMESFFAPPASRSSRVGTSPSPANFVRPIYPSLEEKEVLPTTNDPFEATSHSNQRQASSVQNRNILRRQTSSEQLRRAIGEVDPADMLEDVRSRLQSIQEVFRERRGGDTKSRDEMIDELDYMLDNAIATTIAPSDTDSIRAQDNCPFRRNSSVSPSKIPLASQLSAHPSMKSNTRLYEADETVEAIRDQPAVAAIQKPAPSPTRLLSPLQSPQPYKSIDRTVQDSFGSPTRLMDSLSPRQSTVNNMGISRAIGRHRTVTESALSPRRHPDFPLTSPVRERALLWESLSNQPILENEPVYTAPQNIYRFDLPRNISAHSEALTQTEQPAPPNTRQNNTPCPLIPLALPQLVDAERRRKNQITYVEQVPFKRVHEEVLSDEIKKTVPIPDRRSSVVWPGHLQYPLHRSSSATVHQSMDVVGADSERDEHNPPARPSIVKSKIRDLLASTQNKVSTTVPSSEPSNTGGSEIRKSKIRTSVGEAETDGGKHLPVLQTPAMEQGEIPSHDGPQSVCWTPHRSNGETVFATPPSNRSPSLISPVKPVSSTPARGRSRRTLQKYSPSVSPFSFSHKVTLSPSRSNSCGSRGSVTFSIKARMSPGRRTGKHQDPEVSITTNVGSEESSE